MYSLADMAEICRMHWYMYIKMKYRYLKGTTHKKKEKVQNIVEVCYFQIMSDNVIQTGVGIHWYISKNQN